jgi:N,N'-diacetyllegionaminate synthase
MNLENFNRWNEIKKEQQQSSRGKYFRQGEIWFVHQGQNIGYEVYGKGERFLRPVLIFKKFNNHTFLAIPLTSKIKDDAYHAKIDFADKTSSALLSQIKTMDVKRLYYKKGKIKPSCYDELKKKIVELYQLTPQKEGSCNSQDENQQTNGVIISQNNKNSKVFIIAEAGVNHNGSTELAKKLIDAASDAGADAVKFQTFKAEKLVSRDAKKAAYQQENMQEESDSQFAMLKKLELDVATHKELIAYAQSKNIMFLSTPFDLESIKLLDDLGLEIFKIPSGEITNLPYLRAIAKLGKRVVLSTGMSTMDEVREAFEVLLNNGTQKEHITILHANTMYPTPMEDVNLRAMLGIQKELDVSVGYSDHTLGIEVPIAAVAMGASVIEKHFTLSRDMEGPDHKASLEPHELKAMVGAIRNIEQTLGSSEKKPSASETPNITVARKSIVAARKIAKGEVLSKENLTVKRPGGGINPMQWDEILGKVATKEYDVDAMIEEDI